MPAKERCDQVGEAKDVETAREDGARDAVQRRQVPRDLWLVDGEVGRDGTVETLFDEDFVAVRGFDVRRGCGSGGGNWSVGYLG